MELDVDLYQLQRRIRVQVSLSLYGWKRKEDLLPLLELGTGAGLGHRDDKLRLAEVVGPDAD